MHLTFWTCRRLPWTRRGAAARLLALAGALGAAACTPAAPRGDASARLLAGFDGRVDQLSGSATTQDATGDGRLTLTWVDAQITIQTVGGVATADNCGGPSFEGTVRISNNTGSPLTNVYAQIYDMSLVGREGCNSDPNNGSAAIDNGFWSYGDIPAGGHADRTWRMKNPDSTYYVFHGHVFTVPDPGPTFYAGGSGHGWAAQIQNMYLDSNGSALTVALKLNPIDGANNNLWILVDDTNQATGVADLTLDLTGWGGLGLVNSVGANVDFAFSGYRGGPLASNGSARTWVSDASTPVTGSIATAQDDATGVYTFTIPYTAIGSGAAPGDPVRVYALYGQSASGGGIHSAAPAQSAVQTASMNAASGSRLYELDTPAPTYVLR